MVSKAPRMISVVTGSAVFRDLARTGRGREGARRAGVAMVSRYTETSGADKGRCASRLEPARRHAKSNRVSLQLFRACVSRTRDLTHDVRELDLDLVSPREIAFV